MSDGMERSMSAASEVSGATGMVNGNGTMDSPRRQQRQQSTKRRSGMEAWSSFDHGRLQFKERIKA
jgi:hypothetical protein